MEAFGKFGDEVSIMDCRVTPVSAFIADGIRYELYYSLGDDRGFIRAYNLEFDEFVTITAYPEKHRAIMAHNDLLENLTAQ